MTSLLEATARQRLEGLLDPSSLDSLIPLTEPQRSPHLALLGLPAAQEDGVSLARGSLAGRPVLAAAQEGGFLGGAVGEVHGARLVGLLRLALQERPAAVLLVWESGGVRLHEANAGLIAVSEVMSALLDCRLAGIPVIGLVGGSGGCFGGTGLLARCCSALVMSEEGRLGMSGPEVIETVHGVEEFDSRNRPLVWQVTGGKVRALLGEADALVNDRLEEFRQATIQLMLSPSIRQPLSREAIRAEWRLLVARRALLEGCRSGEEVSERLGLPSPAALALLTAEEYQAATADARARLAGLQAPWEEASWSSEPPRELEALQAVAALRLDSLGLLFAHPVEAFTDGSFQVQAICAGRPVAVMGVLEGAAVDGAMALRMVDQMLLLADRFPGRPLLMLLDTQGQALRRAEELMGLNASMALLAKAVKSLRAAGHLTVSLVTGRAVSGGYLCTGMLAERAFALEGAEVSVMNLPAMSRITKIPLERLEALSRESPVFAPGSHNYARMGHLEAVWSGAEAATRLAEVMATGEARLTAACDLRAVRGLQRGGRTQTAAVVERILGPAAA